MMGLVRIRISLVRACAALALLVSAAWAAAQGLPTPQPTPDLARDKTLYAVGYAHLDTQWRWTYRDTIGQYIPDTFNQNFALFPKYPEYIFNFSGANRYRMMKEYYPADFARVKDYVSKGRWFPCGSAMEESDVNVPSAESIVRQLLYGSRFFRTELGKNSEEYMLPDCFGFPATLPSLLAHSGIKGFSTQKLTWGSAVGIPFNIGIWEGPGGKSVIAALNPGAYVGNVTDDLSRNPEWVARVEENGKKYGVYTDYHYYGVGDRGGAPREPSVQWVEKSVHGTGPVKVVSAEADAMFKAITPEEAKGLPRYQGDLLLTQHSAGSITSQAYMKRWNRKSELLADAAERAAVAAMWMGGAAYPQKKLNDAWTLVMGGQFHDILPGTSVPEAYNLSWNDEILAQNQFAEVLSNSVGAVARAMDTQAKGIPLVVYNPLSIEREDVVEATVAYPKRAPRLVRVFGPDGKETPVQILGADGGKLKILFLAKVPSVGFAVYDVRPVWWPFAKARTSTLRASTGSLENDRYRIKIHQNGDIASIYDKEASRELLSGPMRMAFQYENPSRYPAWNMDWEDQQKPPRAFVEGPRRVRVVENGPVRVTLEITREAQGSKFVQRVRLASGDTGNRVEFLDSIDWKTTSSALKATFPLTVANPLATYNWEVGTVQRGNNDEKKYEVPTHQWIDLTDRDGRYGVTLLTDCKYGSDKPADNTLRLTLLYTPGVRGGTPDQATQDWGRHEILYGLAGHKGDWRDAKTDWTGMRLNQPLLAFQTVPHKGQDAFGKSFPLLNVSTPNARILSIKAAEEDTHKVVVRVAEIQGKPANTMRIDGLGLVDVHEVDGQERPIGDKIDAKDTLFTDLDPYGIRAFEFSTMVPNSVGLPQSTPVELPYNTQVASRDGEAVMGGFDGAGGCLAAEMLPGTIAAEGVEFKLAPRDGPRPDAVACKGQAIALPAGKFNRLYLLAAAAGGDAQTTFKIDNKTAAVPVQDWGGFIGQWDNRVWNRGAVTAITPGYIKPAPVAWFSSHHHDAAGANQIYAYSYLYKIAIDIKPEAKTLTLPQNDKIKILAASVALNPNDATRPAGPLLDVLDRTSFEGTKYTLKAAPVPPRKTAPKKGTKTGKKTGTKKAAAKKMQ